MKSTPRRGRNASFVVRHRSMLPHLLSGLFFLVHLPAHAAPLSTHLSETEKTELEDRLHEFYRSPHNQEPMNREIPKFSVRTNTRITPNSSLELGNYSPSDVLHQRAQAKSLPAFQNARCDYLEKHFKGFQCSAPIPDEEIETNDLVTNLAKTWIDRNSLAFSLNDLPLGGTVSWNYWSGDYWRMQWGLISYRYGEGVQYNDYQTAIGAYAQPLVWQSLVGGISMRDLAQQVLNWSPAEKYDLTVGDESFSLTNQEKQAGQAYIGPDGNVPSWYGICHGWAPSAIYVPAPANPVQSVGAQGVPVTWYPADIQAVASLSWANGSYNANFIGGRCNAKHPARYPNGRLMAQECFDDNPASFHLALGNFIGKAQVPFIMDAAYDYQVWNQPVLSYQFTYFDPTNEQRRSNNWQDVAVNYDDNFKSIDRFQYPLTRGKRTGSYFYDGDIQKVVGVIATVVYLVENDAHSPDLQANQAGRETYTYDLELSVRNGVLVPTGGEWHENTHPDFMWVAQRGSIPQMNWDRQRTGYSLGSRAPYQLTSLAQGASSSSGYPLCEVLSTLVNSSSSSGSYSCH